MNRKVGKRTKRHVVAVSGGPDSMYLLDRSKQGGPGSLVVAHYNHKARGEESDRDQALVESMSRALDISLEIGKEAGPGKRWFTREGDQRTAVPGFERDAREKRHRFLSETKEKYGAEKIMLAHTADDQVETVLMRVLEGGGISGIKGIPRSTEKGIERPLLDTWRDDILRYLKKHDIPYRVDRSNLDTRYERNWVRHVLLPLLEKRYGKSVKKRIFTLGERFREIDAYVEIAAHKWLKYNSKHEDKSRGDKRSARDCVRFSRKSYSGLPSLLRMKILQILCFRRIGTSPNERLLESMDRLIVTGSPSARLSIGKGAALRCRYGEAILSPSGYKAGASGAGEARSGRTGSRGEPKERREEKRRKTGIEEKKKGAAEPVLQMDGQGVYWWNRPARQGLEVGEGSPVSISWEERGRTAPMRIRQIAKGERQAAFDAERLPLPLSVRPLREGDRVRPFGLRADKKVKEILIDRKVPREERWGRPAVCDAFGRIVWIPGILRSADAPVTAGTMRTIVLRAELGREPPS